MSEWRTARRFGVAPDHVEIIMRPSAYAIACNERGELAVVTTPRGCYLPGGGLELDESSEHAVAREAREECGLELELLSWRTRAIEIVFAAAENAYFEKRSVFFGARAWIGPARAIESDHTLQWQPPEAAEAILTPASHRWAVTEWRKYLSSEETGTHHAAPTATTAPEAFGSTLPPGEARANLERARQYLAAIEVGSEMSDAFAFLAPDIVQIEYPNHFVPKGAKRDLAAMHEASERGKRVMRGQRYEVRTAIAQGAEVALEVVWVGTLAMDLGALKAGDEMRAHFGVFLTFRDGLIVRQHNYDCFDAF